jgi:hypothetical protein
MTTSNANDPQMPRGGASHADQTFAVRAGNAAIDARRRIGLVGNRWALFAVAIAAGTCTGAILHVGYPFLRGPTDAPPINHDPAAHAPMHATLRRVEYQNAAGVYGLFGATLSAALAFTEGAARKSARYAAVGIASGITFGGGMGIAGGLIAQWVAFLPTPGFDEMAKTILMRGPSWAIAGMGIGVGFTLPSRCWRTIAAGTAGILLGGVISALVYGPAVGLLFPRVQTELVVPPASADRITWLVVTAGMMGFVASQRGRKYPRVPKLPPDGAIPQAQPFQPNGMQS